VFVPRSASRILYALCGEPRSGIYGRKRAILPERGRSEASQHSGRVFI
jgi:hypothetical protein